MKPTTCALMIAAGCASAVLLAVAVSGVSIPAPGGPDDLDSYAFRPHPGAPLPLAARLIDERGRSVALGEFFGASPVLLVLDYLRCKSLCGLTLRSLVDALRPLPLEPGRDYQLIAISIDPRDKPIDAEAARTTYLDLLDHRNGIGGMHFLTGAPPAVHEIGEAVGFSYRYDPALDEYMHPAGFAVVAPDGIISSYIEGLQTTSQDLVRRLADAEQDKSQDPLTRILLLCHVQGTPLGRLTVPVLAAFAIANLAAVITVAAIFAVVGRRRHG